MKTIIAGGRHMHSSIKESLAVQHNRNGRLALNINHRSFANENVI